MKKAASISAAVALALAGPALADVPVYQSEKAGLEMGGMGQVLGFGQHVADPYKNDDRVYLFLKEARLRASGHYEDFTVNLELGLGPEDAVVAPNPGIAMGLLDFSVNIPLRTLGESYVKVGQFKVPYGREALTYSAFSDFADRSIDYLGFRVGRDLGAAVTLKPGPFTLIGGIFTGGGRDVPPYHYLPERFGVPLLAARAGIGDVDKGTDEYHLQQSDEAVSAPRYAFFVNGLYTKDSLVGHSTVLNVKAADKSLLIDGNWNPYIGKSPFSQGQWWQGGADFAIRAPLGGVYAFSGEAEVDEGGYGNAYGSLNLFGVRAQAAIRRRAFELALRYAVLLPSSRFAANGVAVTGTAPIQELTPALSWYVHGENLKVVADLPVLLRAPVFTEKNVGAYVGTELPDESAILGKTGMVARQNVVEGRLMLQALF